MTPKCNGKLSARSCSPAPAAGKGAAPRHPFLFTLVTHSNTREFTFSSTADGAAEAVGQTVPFMRWDCEILGANHYAHGTENASPGSEAHPFFGGKKYNCSAHSAMRVFVLFSGKGRDEVIQNGWGKGCRSRWYVVPRGGALPARAARWAPQGCARGRAQRGGWADEAGHSSLQGTSPVPWVDSERDPSRAPAALNHAQRKGEVQLKRSPKDEKHAVLSNCPRPN